MTVKTIGMLGGMSWESTAVYYRVANETVRDRLGGSHSARVLLDSLDFAHIASMQQSGDWDGAADLLSARARALEAAGADMMLICTNTMHKVADRIEAAISVPLLHIADAAAAAIRDDGISRVGFLGTSFTMNEDFYTTRLAEHGIEVIVPQAADAELVNRVIFDELVRGVISEASRAEYRNVIGRLADEGAEGMLLACTEIELLIGEADSPVPVFPTGRIHVEAAVELSLDDARAGN